MTHPDELLDPEVQKALDAIRPVPPRGAHARARGRAAFLTEARDLQNSASPSLWQRLLSSLGAGPALTRSPMLASRLSTLTLVLVIGLVLLFSGSAATAYAAQSALPGDPLYGLKSVTEDARVRLNPDPGADADLHLLFAQRRLDEIQNLISRGRYDDIATATRAYERHILQAIGALGQLAVIDPERASLVTDQILASLSSYTAALTAFLARVPNGASQQALEMAVQTSQVEFGPSEIEFVGVITQIQTNQWVISGKTVRVNLQTRIEGSFATGDLARIEALVASDGTLTALEIKPVEEKSNAQVELEFTGVVEQITAGRWVVGGRSINITAQTEVDGEIKPGDIVQVEGLVENDGSLTAVEIKLVQETEDTAGNENNRDTGPGDDGAENENANDGDSLDNEGNDNEDDNSGSGSSGQNNDDKDDQDNDADGQDDNDDNRSSSDDSNDNDSNDDDPDDDDNSGE